MAPDQRICDWAKSPSLLKGQTGRFAFEAHAPVNRHREFFHGKVLTGSVQDRPRARSLQGNAIQISEIVEVYCGVTILA